MSALPGATYSAPGQPLYAPFGSTGGGSQSTITGDIFNWQGSTNTQSLVTFDLTQQNQTSFQLNCDNGSGGQVTTVMYVDSAGDFNLLTAGAALFNVDYLSTHLVSVDAISTTQMDLDGQVLTANPTELLLNGIPIATQSSLSSIADWSLDPAISTVNMAGYDIINGGTGSFSTVQAVQDTVNASLVLGANPLNRNAALNLIASTASANLITLEAQSTTRLAYGQNGAFIGAIDITPAGIIFRDSVSTNVDVLISANTLYATNAVNAPLVVGGTGVFNDLSTQTMTVFSTIHVVSTISSLVLEGQLGNFSTLNSGNISTQSLFVSSINGSEFTSTGITVQVAGVSSLVANSISSLGAVLQTALVSTLQFNPQFSPNLDVNLGLGSLFGNLAGAAAGGLGVLVGGAALGTGIAALTQGRQTNNINSNAYELVNGTTQLQISTLGTPFSTVYRYVSSVSPDIPGQEYFVSTVHSPGVAIRSLSDPLNTVSSPNSTIQSFGQWVALDANLPAVSTVSSFNQVFTSTLYLDGVTSTDGYGARVGAPFLNSGSGMSTFEIFNQNAPQYSGSLRANQINFSYAGLTSNNFAEDILLAPYGGGLNVPPRLAVNSGSTGNAQIAYLSDLPNVDNNFSTLNADVINCSTLNFPSAPGGIAGDNAFTDITGIKLGSMLQIECSTIASSTGDFINLLHSLKTNQAVIADIVLAQQKVLLAPSTCIYSAASDSELVVAADTDVQDLSQVACSAVRLASTLTGANGILTYNQTTDRAVFLNSTLVANTLAYTSEPSMAISSITTNAIQFSTTTVLNISSQNTFFLGETPTILKTNTDFSANFVRGNRLTAISTTTNGNNAYITSYIGGNFVATQYDTFTGFGEFRTDYNASTTTITNSCGAGISAVSLRPTTLTFQTPGTTVLPTISANTFTAQIVSTVATNCSSLTFAGISTVQFATSGTAGAQGQPAGRLVMSGCDIDFGQNDIWAQQIRLGAGNATNSQTEIIFYDAAAGTRGLNTALQDRTLRVISTVNGTTGGYLLDTALNPPFFSTLAGTSTALMAFFPSSINSTIGVSTISIVPPLNYYASVYSSTSQTVTAANTSTLKTFNATAVNVGGFTVNAASVAVPVAGTYEINVSFQFATTTGGATLAQFWLVKNGAAVPQTNSRVSVANNADNLGTVIIYDTATAGDTYGWMFYSADANMTATAVAAGATPAIPSIIMNLRRLG